VDELGIRYSNKPVLRKPYLVCGIDGWVDGGEASTGTAKYLVRKLGATKFAELPISRFHVFQVPGYNSGRPKIVNQDGLVVEHQFPSNEFFYWTNPHAEHDLIVLLGTEPNVNWEEYLSSLFGLIEEMGVQRTYVLGGVLDNTPHTREPNVYCSVSSAAMKEEAERFAIQFSGYEGPGSLASSIVYFAGQRNLEAMSLTVRSTYYPEFSLSIAYNPKGIRAIMKRLDVLLGLGIDMSDLDTAAEELERRIGAVARENPRFKAYLRELEKEYQEVDYNSPLELTSEDALRFAEDLLRRGREQGQDEPGN
jgi:proteasome assembly chaperone (PAC2) family protein